MALLSYRRWERTSGKQLRAGETKGMVKARVAPAIELLEDVVRTPRPASAMATSLRPKPFPRRSPGTMPAAEPPASFALGKALPGIRRGLL
jgi:hypothetical protein